MFYIQFVVCPIRVACGQSGLINRYQEDHFVCYSGLGRWLCPVEQSMYQHSLQSSTNCQVIDCVASDVGFGGHCLGPCLDLIQLVEPRLSCNSSCCFAFFSFCWYHKDVFARVSCVFYFWPHIGTTMQCIFRLVDSKSSKAPT